ncbi:hypothetical protein P10VF_248 [Rhizobium phage vB_RleM_P10VF]|uniref:Uncharacterized protein n=1 Tax=Rhizobium phage vB_RleM_P10VF TaxID=1527770 RepID=A0A076YQG3_9CAUD|nr:hypothetical protein P10VF_248 [Rhizobium phage vB_RleM_P10VF]AIK68461.1 hypothetical protein P10VF_248 [Rhizobium phage vB_RleM_P10VF]
MTEATARLENWGIVDGKKKLFGNVHADTKARFEDGQYVQITPIDVDLEGLTVGQVVETKNSTYLLGEPQPYYDAILDNWVEMMSRVNGAIRNDKKGRFDTGERVTTSTVLEGKMEEWEIIKTRNSTYLLGKRFSV